MYNYDKSVRAFVRVCVCVCFFFLASEMYAVVGIVDFSDFLSIFYQVGNVS